MNKFNELLDENDLLLQRLEDIFDDLIRLNLIKERKITIGKDPQIKISLNKGMRDTYGWEIEVQSDLPKYIDLVVVLEYINTQLKEKFKGGSK